MSLPSHLRPILLAAPALLATVLVTETAARADVPVLEARAERMNSVNVSPLGLVIGAYNVNYERLVGGHHGLLVEGSFARSGDDEASSRSAGANLGYRYHWRGRQDSGFVGLTLGYAMGTGEATVSSGDSSTSFDVDTRVLALTANLGKRWAWDSGVNVTLRVGAGYGNYSVTTDSDDPDAQKAVELVDELLTLLPVAVDGELSIGYTF